MDEYNITLEKIIKHFKTIVTHKWYVFKLCCKYGMIWRGIVHDLSKFTPSEFIPNVKYYKKGISPIDVQKELYGYAPGWMHHKGRNSHHYEYWIDKLDNGGYITRMPFNDILECVCDMLAANKTYKGQGDREYYRLYTGYWQDKKCKSCMHPDNVEFLEIVFYGLYLFELNKDTTYIIDSKFKVKSVDKLFDRYFLYVVYNYIIEKRHRKAQMKIQESLSINKKK